MFLRRVQVYPISKRPSIEAFVSNYFPSACCAPSRVSLGRPHGQDQTGPVASPSLRSQLIATRSADILAYPDNFYLYASPSRLQGCSLNGKTCCSAAWHIINVEKSS